MKAMSERERFAAALEEDIVFGRLKSRKRLVEQDIMDRLQIRRRIRFPDANIRWTSATPPLYRFMRLPAGVDAAQVT